jgi:hypothetical protein
MDQDRTTPLVANVQHLRFGFLAALGMTGKAHGPDIE